MARIDPYTQEIMLDRANPGNIEAAGAPYLNKAQGAMFDAQQAQDRGDSVFKWSQQVARQREIDGQLKARELFNNFQRTKIGHLNDQRNARMTTPAGFAKEFDGWYNNQATEMEDSFTALDENAPFDRQYFRQLVDGDRTDTLARNTDWENGMVVQNIHVGIEQNLDEMNSNFILTNPQIKDIPGHIGKIRQYVKTTGDKVLSPEEQYKLMEYGVDRSFEGAIDSILQTNPQGLKDTLVYGEGRKDQLIDMTMFDIEGGDKLVQEPDGSVSKFGIKSGQGLSVEQVKALTADDARQIYGTRYWDSRLDKMEPAMRAVAFDTLVNHGNDKDAWKMITEANGDPYTLIQLRQQKYAGLVTGNPEKYGKYANGWNNRIAAMTNYVQSLDNGGRELVQIASLVGPDVLVRARASIEPALAAKQREAAAVAGKNLTAFNASFKDSYDTTVKNAAGPGPDELNQLEQLAINSGDADAINKARWWREAQPGLRNLKSMSDSQIAATIRQQQALVNKNRTPSNQMMLEAMEGIRDMRNTQVKEQGLAYYGAMGTIAMPQPIDFSDPRKAANNLRSREDAALSIYQRDKRLLPVMTPDEITQLQEAYKQMPADQMAGMLQSFDALSPRAKLVLAEAIDQKSTVLGVAMAIDDMTTRRRILQGEKIAKNNPPTYDEKLLNASIGENFDALVKNPEVQADARKVVKAYYDALTAEQGAESDKVNADRVRQSVQAVYGPIVNVSLGNTDEVFSFIDPATNKYADQDEVYNMFHGMTDDHLKKMFGDLPIGAQGEQITADDIKRHGRIISAGTGQYTVQFQNGDVWANVLDKSGKPLKIYGDQLLDLYRKSGSKKAMNPADYPISNPVGAY